MGGFADFEDISSADAVGRNLNRLHGLNGSERGALVRLLGEGQWIGAGEVVFGEGRAADGACALLEGWAYRCKDFRDGRRQITAFLIAGDLIHLEEASPARAVDHAVRTLTPARIARISREDLNALRDHPALAAALRTAAVLERATLRAWVVNLGLRPAPERMAHLFCELATRLAVVESASPTAFELPLSQQALAWALGLTKVHVNRVFQQLRRDGLVDFRDGVLAIPDLARLEALADFDGAYLAA